MSDPGQGPDDRPVLLLVTGDLFLGSRLAGLAERAGYRAVSAPTVERAQHRLSEGPVDRVLVDLSTPGAEPASFAAASPDPASRIAAYAPHVRVDLLKAARAAGLKAVFTRGQLESELPRWLAGSLRRRPAEPASVRVSTSKPTRRGGRGDAITGVICRVVGQFGCRERPPWRSASSVSWLPGGGTPRWAFPTSV
ncbi:MAG TPA: hypothetical protein VF170_03920 [Planctomycetaceae bacterium]